MDADQSLLAWVNANRLSKVVKDLRELADGVLLTELLTQVSVESFQPLVSAVPPEDWPGKLDILRKLHSALITYLEVELALQHPLLSADLDLVSIAINGDKVGLRKLLQLAILAITHCEKRDIFIARIRKLNESVQTDMMMFIRGTLERQERGDSGEVPRSSASELARLRQDKHNLAAKVDKSQMQLELMIDSREAFEKQIEDLKARNQTLEEELLRRVCPDLPGRDSLMTTLEANVSQKDRALISLQAQLEEERRITETKLAALRDEVDVANERISRTAGTEATLVKYKKKLEDMAEVKAKVKRLHEENEDLKQQLKGLKEVSESQAILQKQTTAEKEKTQRLKSKHAALKNVAAEKEAQLGELRTRNTDLASQLQLAQLKCQEATEQLDRLLLWESNEVSFEGVQSSPQHREVMELTQELAQAKFMRAKAEEEVQLVNTNYARDVARLKAEMMASGNMYTQESASLRLKLQKLESELTSTLQHHNSSKSDLLARNQFLETHFKQVEEDLKSLKKEKETIMGEVRTLRRDKEELTARYLESREQEVKLIKELSERQVRFQALETAHHLEESKSYQSKSNSEAKVRALLLVSEQRISQLEADSLQTQGTLREREETIKKLRSEAEAKGDVMKWRRVVMQKDAEIAFLSKAKEELTKALSEERRLLFEVMQEMDTRTSDLSSSPKSASRLFPS